MMNFLLLPYIFIALSLETHASDVNMDNGNLIIDVQNYKGIQLTLKPFVTFLRSYVKTLYQMSKPLQPPPNVLLKNVEEPDNTSSSLQHSTHENTLEIEEPNKPHSRKESNLKADTSREIDCITNRGRTPDRPCIFPFIYKGIMYTTCTWRYNIFTNNKAWCSTKVNESRNHIKGYWGNCDPERCPNKYPPRECGVPAKSRRTKRIIKENGLSIQEVPWMASLGKFSNGEWDHKCGGSLISHRFILTSAHCLALAKDYRVRLGNADLNIHNWVRRAYIEKKESSLYEIKSAIKRTYLHPNYILHQSYFDVGLAETEEYIPYTDYVRPICLPFEMGSGDDFVNELVTIAGWGENENGTVSNELRRTRLQVYSKKQCENTFPGTKFDNLDGKTISGSRIHLPEGIAHDLICIGSDIQHTGACYGDSGSPSVRKVFDTTREPYYEQLFIVTTGTSCDETSTIYSKVYHPKTLPWIRKITGMEHHLVAIGGFSPNRTNKLLRDVEFISSSPSNLCQNKIALLNGKLTKNLFHSAAARGRTGIVSKDGLFVCGGTNSMEHLKTCHVYYPQVNVWSYAPSLNYSRADASAVLSPDGHFWILGGANGSRSADSTEVLDLEFNKWRRASPLPSELRNSGISYHCSVRLNQSHVFLAGGYAAPYVFRNPFEDRSSKHGSNENEDGLKVPGISLKAAWIFDGFYWKRIKDMQWNRDRLACSILNHDGQIRVIVAGGCREWCEISPAISDVEIYNPNLDEWNIGPSLPEPLHSAKMEEYLGRPTIVGGFNGTAQVDRIYSYFVETNEWKLLSKKLRLPRSSHALVRVPYEMFEHC